MWTPKNLKRIPVDSCATAGKAVEILSPLETGTAWGRLRDAGSTGKPARHAGFRYRRAARNAGLARRLASRVRRSQARPPPSHTWRGPCRVLPDKDILPVRAPRANMAALTKAGKLARIGPGRGSAGIPPHPQGGGLAEDQPARCARVVRIQPQPGEPGQQGPDGDLRLEPGQVRAQAEMRAVRKGQVAPG